MNRIRRTRRWAAVITGLACALLTSITAAPAALAERWPPPGGGTVPPGTPAPAHVTVISGMSAWQTTLIAAAAAILAATIAVALDRIRASRQHKTTSPA